MKNDKMNVTGNFRDGQWNVVHLKFLVDFMKAAGLSTVQVAGIMGLTRQSVYYWFAKDDMKISQVYRLFSLCGYRISFSLKGKSPPPDIKSDVIVNIKVNRPGDHRNLAFMKQALDDFHISRDCVAERLQVSKSTVARWFATDECFVSYVYKVADAAGLKLHIDIEAV
ncbi:MAG: hypothetical protein E7117_00775 [Bacteroidales bacterium]|nr:hypothetical protein [Bacteroidales bacterium]